MLPWGTVSEVVSQLGTNASPVTASYWMSASQKVPVWLVPSAKWKSPSMALSFEGSGIGSVNFCQAVVSGGMPMPTSSASWPGFVVTPALFPRPTFSRVSAALALAQKVTAV